MDGLSDSLSEIINLIILMNQEWNFFFYDISFNLDRIYYGAGYLRTSSPNNKNRPSLYTLLDIPFSISSLS